MMLNERSRSTMRPSIKNHLHSIDNCKYDTNMCSSKVSPTIEPNKISKISPQKKIIKTKSKLQALEIENLSYKNLSKFQQDNSCDFISAWETKDVMDEFLCSNFDDPIILD